MTEIWNLSALCRCCHADGYFKGLQVPYKNGDTMEIYSALLFNTFGVTMNQPPVNTSHTICDNCIQHLRVATQFKQQVLECERKFMEYCNNEQALEIKVEPLEEYDKELESKPPIILSIETCDVKHYDSDSFDNRSEGDIKDEDHESKVDTKPPMQDGSNKRKKIKDVKIEAKSKPTKATKNTMIKKRKNKISESLIDHTLEIKVENEYGVVYSCKLCEGTYAQLEELQTHIRNNHKIRRVYRCQMCDMEFTTKGNEHRHMKLHHNVSGYKCELCQKYFTTKNSLNVHERTHTKEKPFKCELCSKDFAYAQTLRNHMKLHNGTNKRFVCDLCGHTFNDRTNLSIHIRVVHEKARPFPCTLCPKTYSTKNHLTHHMMRHKGIRPYQCEVCAKSFITISCLKNHKTVHESGGYKCVVCEKVYKERKGYTQHVRSHGNALPYKCFICYKTFSCKYSMKRHVDEHTSGKAYSCDICQQRFNQKSMVVRHMQRKHAGPKTLQKCDVCKRNVTDLVKHKINHVIKPYQCDLCERCYSAKTALNRHLRYVHYNVKSFACDMCDKKYIMKKSLRRHLLKVHKVKTEQDDDGNEFDVPIENNFHVDILRAPETTVVEQK